MMYHLHGVFFDKKILKTLNLNLLETVKIFQNFTNHRNSLTHWTSEFLGRKLKIHEPSGSFFAAALLTRLARRLK